MANAHISKGARARVLVVVGAIAAISVIVGVSPQPASAAPAPVYGQYCRSGYPIRSVSTSDRVVSFTYDDGPWPTNTAAVMSTFERYGWRADFFMIGNNINRYPDIARSVVRRGHGVHAHSVTHRYGASTIAAEAARSRDILQRVTGVRSTFFRAPGLTRSSTIDRAVYAAGMCNISTGSDLGDWKSPRASAWTLCSRFKRALRPGAIILLHDGGSHRQTVDSVSCMLDHVRRSGYQVVGLGALLSRQYSANPAPQPAPAPSTTCSTSLWGQRGTKVAAAQRALMNSGIYLRGGADGVYGTYTLSAVRTFQAARRLPVTGAVNRATAVALGICPSGSSGGGSTATPTPTPAPAPSAWSTIRVGQRGTEVASMQRAIINSGIRLVGGADGIFGRYTQAALRTYQSRNRLPISGALDQATAVKMRLFTPSGSSPTVRSWTTIRAGQRGSTVASMQRAIIASGIYLLGGADGIFGRYSEAALRRYQSAKRVPVTGVLDQATAIKMGLFTAPPPTTTTTTTTTTTAPPSSTTTSSTTTSSTTTSSTTTSSTTRRRSKHRLPRRSKHRLPRRTATSCGSMTATEFARTPRAAPTVSRSGWSTP